MRKLIGLATTSLLALAASRADAQTYPTPAFANYAQRLASTSALKALGLNSAVKGGYVRREGWNAPGDGGAADYTWSAAACSLNGGAGDDALQVAPNGGGCLNAVVPAAGLDVRLWGAVCGGDATAAYRKAALASAALGAMRIVHPSCAMTISGTINLPSNTSVHGTYGASVLNVASAATWGGAIGDIFEGVSGGQNYKIEDLTFQYPAGGPAMCGTGACHTLGFIGNSHILIRDNVADGAGDFTAIVGSTDVDETGNRVTHAWNACYDHWNSFTDVRVHSNYCSTLSGLTGVAGIQFTGITTGLTAANSNGYIATDNIVYMNSAGQGINVNGYTGGGGADNKGTIALNHIHVAAGIQVWGTLVTGAANYGTIESNYYDEVTATGAQVPNNVSAVGVEAPAIGWTVSHNIAWNWTGSGNGVFQHQGTGGALVGNRAYSSSAPLIGAVSATVSQFDNDNGTGNVNVNSLLAVYAGMQNTSGVPATPSYGFIGNAGLGMYSPFANALGFTSQGVTRLLIDATGNVATLSALVAEGTPPAGNTGSCAASSFVGGAMAGKFTAAACAAGTIILSGLPAAPNGYACAAMDQTTPADTLVQTANTTTSATFKATTAASDVVVFKCMGF